MPFVVSRALVDANTFPNPGAGLPKALKHADTVSINPYAFFFRETLAQRYLAQGLLPGGTFTIDGIAHSPIDTDTLNFVTLIVGQSSRPRAPGRRGTPVRGALSALCEQETLGAIAMS